MDFLKEHRRIQKTLGLLIFMTFDLMVLGAGVRAMDAGLTCPDWPLCFGRVVPAYHLGVYLEFIHRAIAGLVALLFSFLFFQIYKKKSLSFLRPTLFLGALLLLSQIIMGALTVLKLLEFWTVTLHLMLATGFLATLLMVREKLKNQGQEKVVMKETSSIGWLGLGLCLVLVQMVLGALVASTYAGTICIDFPTCNGQWFPPLIGPIALQMIHRWGAFLLVAYTIALVYRFRLFHRVALEMDGLLRLRMQRFSILVGCQFIFGILNLVMELPTVLTVLHSALAILIFSQIFLSFTRGSLAVGQDVPFEKPGVPSSIH